LFGSTVAAEVPGLGDEQPLCREPARGISRCC
jgi:hypothetical protein